MQLFIYFISFFLLCGCASEKISQNFDRNLTPQGVKLARNTKLLFSNDSNSQQFYFNDLHPDLKDVFTDKGINRLEIINVQESGRQCSPPPMALILTLGLWPRTCENEYQIEFNYYDSNLNRTTVHKSFFTVKEYLGWAALFLGTVSSRKESDKVKLVIFTEINKIAEK